MQKLQWFPGHMTKALRMIETEQKLCDAIIYVLDARAPFACTNFKLDEIFKQKPVIYALNKSDLVEEKDLLTVIKTFEKQGKKAVAVVGTSDKSAKILYNAVIDALKPLKERYKLKGINKPFRVMFAGIPNTGKSTLINLLSGGKKTRTGDKAGVTRDKQWIKIKELELLDTPGTTPPSFDSQKNAEYLAYIGSINDDILDFIELSCDLIGFLREKYSGKLEEVYKISTEEKTNYEVFLEIGKARGAFKKGGEIDEDKTSKLIINDFRKQKLGKIILL